jgi:ATP-dependent RNA helicase RhlE
LAVGYNKDQRSVTLFSAIGLAEPILKALAAEGYSTPTPIQTQAIPPVLAGRDLIGLAQTGTGKTAAFALPMLHRLAQTRRQPRVTGCRALILAPTRELAAQIEESFRAYGRFLGLTSTVVFGGASMHRQKLALARGVDILVATPGRLIDHIGQRTARIDGVEILVLDEADHMLDMGFIHALKRIAALLPKERQTLFFSATMPGPIETLAAQFLNDPVQVAVAPVSSTAERVEQGVIHVSGAEKHDLLHALLADKTIARALVFARTKHGADRIVRRLEAAGFPAEAIHGNKRQGQRMRALEAFKSGEVRLLVATEIAARGIDVDGVTHVINFDLPNVPEQYVHRIGRTARAGAAGMAISFCAPDERAFLRDIERLTKLAIPVMAAPAYTPSPPPPKSIHPVPQGRNANGGGGRPPQSKPPQKQAPRRPAPGANRGGPSTNTGDPGQRTRKGEEMWSNEPAGPPRSRQRPRRAG